MSRKPALIVLRRRSLPHKRGVRLHATAREVGARLALAPPPCFSGPGVLHYKKRPGVGS